MRIEVVGTGCPTCERLYEVAKKAASELDADYEVSYIHGADGMKRLMELGLMRSPALVVNDRVVIVGFEPNVNKIKEKISEVAS